MGDVRADVLMIFTISHVLFVFEVLLFFSVDTPNTNSPLSLVLSLLISILSLISRGFAAPNRQRTSVFPRRPTLRAAGIAQAHSFRRGSSMIHCSV